MKTIQILIAAATLGLGAYVVQADELMQTLQKGLYAEEAEDDLSAAIEAYRSVIEQFEANRKTVATAMFRMAECYRKLDREDDAARQYEAIIERFPEQGKLVELSQQNLKGMGVSLPEKGAAGRAGIPEEEARELRRVQELVRNSPDRINALNEEGRTPLHEAVRQEHLRVARLLLENGAAANGRDEDGKTALHYAAQKAHKTLAELLLDNGAEIDVHDSDGATPLYIALHSRYGMMAELLLERGADPNLERAETEKARLDPYHYLSTPYTEQVPSDSDVVRRVASSSHPLHMVAAAGFDELVELLLEHGADLEATDRRGQTAVHKAVEFQRKSTLKLLIEKGADVNVADGMTPLAEAARTGRADITRVLLQAGADPSPTGKGSPPMRHAVYAGSHEVVKLLLKHGANVDYRLPNTNQTLLHLAAAKGYPDVAKILLDHGVEVNAQTDEKVTPLHEATKPERISESRIREKIQKRPRGPRRDRVSNVREQVRQQIGTATVILEGGADPNLADAHGHLPLLNVFSLEPSELSKRRVSDLIKLLLERGADPNVADERGHTPLLTVFSFDASQLSGLSDVIKLLLEHGADPNVKGEDGEAPIHMSDVLTKNPEILQLLLEHGADPNLRNRHGATALWNAVGPTASQETVQLLLDGGADPDMKLSGREGALAPLHRTVRHRNLILAKLLLDHGATVDIRDAHGRTPLYWAVKDNRPESVRLFLDAGASLDLRADNGFTPLQQAVADQTLDLTEILLRHGADANIRQVNESRHIIFDIDWQIGEAPLHVSAKLKNDQLATLLLAQGAAPNLQDFEGNTPLHRAVNTRFMPVIEALLDHDADPNIPNEAGDTPYSLALEEGYDNVVEALRQKTGPTTISVKREDFTKPVFFKRPDGINQFTLLECIAEFYEDLNSRDSKGAFPDLSGIEIHRRRNGETEVMEVDLHELVEKDEPGVTDALWLEWGDVVYIPEMPHRRGERWKGFPKEIKEGFLAALQRKVRLRVREQDQSFVLGTWCISKTRSGPIIIQNQSDPEDTDPDLCSFRLRRVLNLSDMLYTTSDLSRVTIQRKDPESGETRELVFNAEKPHAGTDVWLRDGDIIEVPDKEEE